MGAAALATAVIAAAGSGERLGAGGPKALVEVAGRPLLAWSLLALEGAGIEQIVVAAPRDHQAEVWEVARETLDIGAIVVVGGGSRSESVAKCVEVLDGPVAEKEGFAQAEIVLVHDAARPLVTPAVFAAIVSELAGDTGCDALVAAAPVADTVKRALAGRVIETVPRSELWAVQTPQAFRAEALRNALHTDTETLAQATDDASLVETAGGVVRLHHVTAPNPKLTTESDLVVIEALLRDRRSS
ncbi:MAG: 2-C-methyl-D-erythritol 4-phosphate cytidylyltransferase [Actinomycetota bacterium]|nr:2-C-methyl-D-erythritol 4-phosphate cytidylyltransferase [Actinomycetota bacterium]